MPRADGAGPSGSSRPLPRWLLALAALLLLARIATGIWTPRPTEPPVPRPTIRVFHGGGGDSTGGGRYGWRVARAFSRRPGRAGRMRSVSITGFRSLGAARAVYRWLNAAAAASQAALSMSRSPDTTPATIPPSMIAPTMNPLRAPCRAVGAPSRST